MLRKGEKLEKVGKFFVTSVHARFFRFEDTNSLRSRVANKRDTSSQVPCAWGGGEKAGGGREKVGEGGGGARGGQARCANVAGW